MAKSKTAKNVSAGGSLSKSQLDDLLAKISGEIAQTPRWTYPRNRFWNEPTAVYKSNPTMRNYVSLRRAHPNQIINTAITGGESKFDRILNLLQEFEIDPLLVD